MNSSEATILDGSINPKKHSSAIPYNSSQKSDPIDTTPSDLWDAIRTIIELQNEAPPLLPVSHGKPSALSFPQERLLLLEQLSPGKTTYNIPLVFHINGFLNLCALEKSFNELIIRHEALRTSFSWINEQPVQVISSSSCFKLLFLNLCDLHESDQNLQVSQIIHQEIATPFKLEHLPLFRVVLIQKAADEFILMINFHHIIFDGWSEGIFCRELGELYKAFSKEIPSPLVDLPLQYADYAIWQRQWIQSSFRDALTSYWQTQLAGKLTELRLPIDQPRPAISSGLSAKQLLPLSSELTVELKSMSKREGTTLFVLLLTAFKVLLYQYTEQQQIFLCSPIANRNRSELKGLIGYFVNLLVLQSDISEDWSFLEFLVRVRQMVAGAYAHQDLPIQHLVDCLDSCPKTLSNVMFVLQNTPKYDLSLVGLEVSRLEADGPTANFDLFLSITEKSGILICELKYNTDLFLDDTISRLLQHFRTVLENVVASPQQKISLLLPLNQEELLKIEQSRGNHRTTNFNRIEQVKVTQEHEAPRNEIEFKLTQIWQQLLNLQTIGIKDNFFELGGESLLALSLFTQIEQVFGKNLPLSTLIQSPTIELLADVLSREEVASAWSSLVPLQPYGFKPPFFCVHGQDGNVLSYRPLAIYLGSDQPFYGLQARGLDGALKPLVNVEAMAEAYIQEIRSIQPQGPYFLGGYSFGGVIAFEIAQQLLSQKEDIALLVLMDTFGPNCFKRSTTFLKLSRHFNNLSRFGPKYILKNEPFVQSYQNLAIKLYRLARRPLPHNLQRIAIRTACRIAEKQYIPKVYPGRITLFRANRPPDVDWYMQMDKPTPEEWLNRDPLHGWDELATGGVDLHDIPGNHASAIKHERNIKFMAEKLSYCLDNAMSSGSLI